MTRSLVAVLAGCLLLAGCGEPSAEEVRTDYCATVKDHQRALSDRLAGGSPTALLDAQPIFQDLADTAPGDIADDWGVVLDAIEGLDDALTDAGVDPATYDPAKPPEDLGKEQRDDIERAAAELLNPRTKEAVAAVDQQARDVCGTPLFQ